MYKALAERNPNAFNSKLAMSLYNLSLVFVKPGIERGSSSGHQGSCGDVQSACWEISLMFSTQTLQVL